MGGPGTRATRYERQTSADKTTPWKKVIGPTKSGRSVQKMDIYIIIYIYKVLQSTAHLPYISPTIYI